MPSPFILGRRHKHLRYTAGNLTINSGSWAALGVTDLVLPRASAGDTIEVIVNGSMASTGGEWHYFDVASVVAGSAVSLWSTGAAASGSSGQGFAFAPQQDSGGGSNPYPIVGTIARDLVTGDIENGAVTLRVMFRQSTAGAKTVYANTTVPFYWSARNLGPPAT